MLMRHVVALSLLTASSAVLADALDVNLSNNTAQFQYSTATGIGSQGKSDIHLGVLYNNNNSVMANAGLLVMSSQDAAPGLSIGVGVEGLVATIKDNAPLKSNGSAVALNGQVRYSPPAVSQLGFVGGIHYAPKIITFGDATRYREFDARVEYELSPQTLVYVGYRNIVFGIKNNRDATVDNGGHVGIKIAF